MKGIVNNSLFIPIVLFLFASIIAVVVIMLTNKKNKLKTVVPISGDDSYSILPDVPMEEVNKSINNEQTVVDPTPLPITADQTPNATPPPTIDVPIPETDDTSFTIEPIKPLINENLSESIVVEKTTPMVENNISSDEIVNVERFNQITNEVEQSVEIEHTHPLDENNVNQDEIVNLNISSPLDDRSGVAFKSIPTNNTTINTDIKTVETNEYDGNKTEIFNLEDIQEELNKE